MLALIATFCVAITGLVMLKVAVDEIIANMADQAKEE